jgi:pyruvate/2-oxoglutarate dehydrogenase complex dihydrolipoamide dehydrogenase (E3) component
VHLIEVSGQILGRENRNAAELVTRALQRDGVRIQLHTKLSEVRSAPSGTCTLVLDGPQGRSEAACDRLLVSVGRAPNVQGLGLDQAGVEHDERRGVHVDDHLRTTNHRVYAAGDVCSSFRFTHVADAAAGIVVRNALFFGRARASALTVPWCTYTDPEVAHVGLDPAGALERGLAVDTHRVEMEDVDRAVLDGDTEGFLEVHVERGRDRIVGATLVSRHAGETISEITAAMVAGGGLKTLASTIHPYPTQADVVRRAANLYLRSRLRRR